MGWGWHPDWRRESPTEACRRLSCRRSQSPRTLAPRAVAAVQAIRDRACDAAAHAPGKKPPRYGGATHETWICSSFARSADACHPGRAPRLPKPELLRPHTTILACEVSASKRTVHFKPSTGLGTGIFF